MIFFYTTSTVFVPSFFLLSPISFLNNQVFYFLTYSERNLFKALYQVALIFYWDIPKYSATDLIFEKAFTIFSAVFPAQSTNVWKSFLVACCPSA